LFIGLQARAKLRRGPEVFLLSPRAGQFNVFLARGDILLVDCS